LASAACVFIFSGSGAARVEGDHKTACRKGAGVGLVADALSAADWM
jgi:hypothetical protein